MQTFSLHQTINRKFYILWELQQNYTSTGRSSFSLLSRRSGVQELWNAKYNTWELEAFLKTFTNSQNTKSARTR
jgi:hypothetical protein